MRNSGPTGTRVPLWVPAGLRRSDVLMLHYVVVDELESDRVGLCISPWPISRRARTSSFRSRRNLASGRPRIRPYGASREAPDTEAAYPATSSHRRRLRRSHPWTSATGRSDQ